MLVPVRAPRGGLPANMQQRRTYHFWADVAIPKGTTAGTYTTTIELTSAGVAVGNVAVQLTVWPFLLPEETAVPLIAELDHRRLFSFKM